MNMPLSRQSGATLLILMLVMMTVFASLLVSSLRGRNAEDTRREQSAAAIEKARQALLAWSLSRDGTAGTGACSGGSVGRACSPAELPCPDLHPPGDVNEGLSGKMAGAVNDPYICYYSTTTPHNAERIGRLPWRTLGINKLTDAYGEPLWYAVDAAFAVRKSGSEDRKINSDSFAVFQVFTTDGMTNYSLNGETAAAVIFAPGPPLLAQNRVASSLVDQFLEGANGKNNATLAGPYIAGVLSATFNDQLGVVTGRELIDRAQHRLGNVVSGLLMESFVPNAATPTPVPANNPAPACQNSGKPWWCSCIPYLNNAPGGGNSCPVPTPTPVVTPMSGAYPFPANMNTAECKTNNVNDLCVSQADLCTGILPRTLTGSSPSWYRQNVWHRAVFYAVKQGACNAPFEIDNHPYDGTTYPLIDALFILPGAVIRPSPNPIARANNLVVSANASSDLALYLEDSENVSSDIVGKDKWAVLMSEQSATRKFVTPSCSSNDVMYTCMQGVCTKRKCR